MAPPALLQIGLGLVFLNNIGAVYRDAGVKYNPCDNVHEFFPDPLDCSKFYHCDGYLVFHKDCPPGLHWDVKINRCEYPENAQCGEGSYPTNGPNWTKSPNPTRGPKPTPPTRAPVTVPIYNPCDGRQEFFPDPDDCTKFYHCDGYLAYHKDCPAKLYWDVITNRCKDRAIAQCGGSVPWSTKGTRPTYGPWPSKGPKSTPSPVTLPEYNPCDGKQEFFPDPDDCTKFYHCDGYLANHKDCPANLYWDVITNRCQGRDIAQCGGSVPWSTKGPRPTYGPWSSKGPKTTPSPVTLPEYNPCDGKQEFFPDPDDCTKFYHCDVYLAYHKVCPAKLYWDVITNRCKDRDTAQCGGSVLWSTKGPRPTYGPWSSKGPKSTPSPVTLPEYNPCDGKQEFFPDPDDCTKFYHCDGYLAYHKDCPAKLYWDVITNRCKDRDIAQCSGSVPWSTKGPRPTYGPWPSKGPKSTPSPVTLPEYNPCDGKQEFFPDLDDCTKFYHCDGYLANHKDCPANLYWDVITNRCQGRDIAQCGGSVPWSTKGPKPTHGPWVSKYPMSTPSPTTLPEYNPCNGKQEFFPDPDDCTKFYHCDGYQAYHKDCPANLYWDVITNRCKGRDIAQCSTSGPWSTKGQQPSTAVTAPEYNPCDGIHAVFPDPDDCTKFYRCNGYRVFHVDCPTNLHWDVTLNRCASPEIAHCSSYSTATSNQDETTTSRSEPETIFPATPRTTTQIEPRTTPGSWTTTARQPPTTKQSPLPKFDLCSVHILYADPLNCSNFYHCSGGVPQLRSCPDGKEWNSLTNRCECHDLCGCRKKN